VDELYETQLVERAVAYMGKLADYTKPKGAPYGKGKKIVKELDLIQKIASQRWQQ